MKKNVTKHSKWFFSLFCPKALWTIKHAPCCPSLLNYQSVPEEEKPNQKIWKKKKIILKYWFLTKTFETEIPMFTSLPSIFFSFAWIKQVHHGDYSTESIPQHGNLLFTSKEKKRKQNKTTIFSGKWQQQQRWDKSLNILISCLFPIMINVILSFNKTYGFWTIHVIFSSFYLLLGSDIFTRLEMN